MKKLATFWVNRFYSEKSTHSSKAADNYSVMIGIFKSGESLMVNAVTAADVIIFF